MEQPVSSGENSPVKQKFRRPQVARFHCSPNPFDYLILIKLQLQFATAVYQLISRMLI